MAAFPPWLVPKDSLLLNQLLNLKGNPFSKNYLVPVGLDPSAIKAKYPDMDVVAIGPIIFFARTVNEKFFVASIEKTSQSIQTIIQSQ